MAHVEELEQVSTALSNAKGDLVSKYFSHYRSILDDVHCVDTDFLEQKINVTKEIFIDNIASTQVPDSAKIKHGDLLALR